MDEFGNTVPDIKPQETPPGVDDALLSAAESLGSIDSFERLPEADNAAGKDKVRWWKILGKGSMEMVNEQKPAHADTHTGRFGGDAGPCRNT